MSYIENQQQWRRLIEVDWFGQYIKAWIAFNAWYRNSFSLKYDWQIIAAIKDGESDICLRIENFLSGNGSVHKSFQANVADLHRLLSDTVIEPSRSKRISFEKIEDYQHAKPVEEWKNNMSYKIEIDIKEKKRIVTITKSNGTNVLCKTIEKDASLDIQQLTCLSNAQQRFLEELLNESTPVHNLLNHHPDNYLEIGSFRFIDNTNLIARAIIENLYQLRNALFHGEIVPNSETQEVYQPAYLILKSIIPGA